MIYVCGPPSTGTSAFAAVLHFLGYDFGEVEGPNNKNPHGNFENTALWHISKAYQPHLWPLADKPVALADALHERIGQLSITAAKLPVFCFTLKHFITPDDRVLFTSRDFTEAKMSLVIHHGMRWKDADAAMQDYLMHQGELIESCPCPHIRVDFAWLQQPEQLIHNIAQFLDVPVTDNATDAIINR